ncbi:MAG: hypothetical protein PUK49_03525 [Oscillospiraceae bacterium]|nr:hypothetical protein [Oscillospiraceae bacterium]
MKIWLTHPNVDKYMWILFSERNDMKSSRFEDHLSKLNCEGKEICFDKKILFHFQNNNLLPTGDIMYASPNYWLAGSKAQKLISGRFGGSFQFIPAICENEPEKEYFIMLPRVFCEGLDPERSTYKYLLDTDYIGSVQRYVFNDNAMQYPFFMLKDKKYFYDAGRFFSNDEFKHYIESNNITGLVFERVYDSGIDVTAQAEPTEKKSVPLPAPQKNNTRYAGIYKIPLSHETGTFLLGKLDSNANESFAIDYDGHNMIINKVNSYVIYDIDDCDPMKNIEVTYRNGRLFSAYIYTPKGRLPVCFYFDFSGKGESEELQMVINECIELCVSELLSGLEKAEKPLRSLLFRYYEYSIWLSYGGDECYMNKGTSNYMMDCICNFAGCFLPLREYNSIRENTYKKIIWGVYEKIAADIPKHFEVKDDFQVYEPEMYD